MNRLRELRLERKLSSRQLLALLRLEGIDLDQSQLSRIESGSRDLSPQEIVAFAKVFHVKTYELFVKGSAEDAGFGQEEGISAEVAR